MKAAWCNGWFYDLCSIGVGPKVGRGLNDDDDGTDMTLLAKKELLVLKESFFFSLHPVNKCILLLPNFGDLRAENENYK